MFCYSYALLPGSHSSLRGRQTILNLTQHISSSEVIPKIYIAVTCVWPTHNVLTCRVATIFMCLGTPEDHLCTLYIMYECCLVIPCFSFSFQTDWHPESPIASNYNLIVHIPYIHMYAHCSVLVYNILVACEYV